MLIVYLLFCAHALAEQKPFAPAPRGAIGVENRGIPNI
jgi:hypothetical protein